MLECRGNPGVLRARKFLLFSRSPDPLNRCAQGVGSGSSWGRLEAHSGLVDPDVLEFIWTEFKGNQSFKREERGKPDLCRR